MNLTIGRGGEGVRAGDSGGELGWCDDGPMLLWLSGRLLLLGGGAGGGPLLDWVLPVFWGLINFILVVGVNAGGGGGGALARLSTVLSLIAS